MFILNVLCETPSFLRIMYFVNILRRILFIILPIALIFFITLKFYKNIVKGDSDVKESLNIVLKKLLAVVMLFFVPFIVNFVISFTDYDIKDSYNSCLANATIEKINYYTEVQDKVYKVEDIISKAKQMPTIENLNAARDAVSELYGVANGTIIEDLEYELGTLSTKITMSNAEFNCKISGGVYKDNNCVIQRPTVVDSSNVSKSSNGMVYYTFKSQNDYLVINSTISVVDYVKYIKANKICQTQSKDFRYGDQCLCFAEEHAHALVTGDTHKTAAQVNESYYSSSFISSYDNDNKSIILNMIYSSLVSNKPVILQVNGRKDGTTRHYVTVIGFRNGITSASNLKDTDLLYIDSNDGGVYQLHDWGTPKFMTTGAKCGKKYSGYQVYIVK